MRQCCGSGRHAADAGMQQTQGCSILGLGTDFSGQTWGQPGCGKAEGRGRMGSKRIASVN